MPHGLAFTPYRGLGISQKLHFEWRIIVGRIIVGMACCRLLFGTNREITPANSLTEEEITESGFEGWIARGGRTRS